MADKTAKQLAKEKADADKAAAEAERLDALYRALNFEEQCFLIDNLETVQKAKNTGGKLKHLARIDGSPYEVINGFLPRAQIKDFFEASPAALAALAPHFRLFKVQYDKFGRRVAEHEFPFEDHFTRNQVDSIVNKSSGRQHGVGLKSFSYTHDSSNPANLKTIKSTLVLHFQDFESLITEFPVAGTGKCNKMSYFDLLRYANFCDDGKGKPQNIVEPPIKEKNKSSFSRDTAHFRIRAYIGHRGMHQTMKDIPDGSKILEAAELSGYTLFLEMVNQQIKFNQNGSLDLTVDFQGAIERAFNSRDMNVLAKGRKTQIESGISDSDKLVKAEKARNTKIKKLQAERNGIVTNANSWNPEKACTYQQFHKGASPTPVKDPQCEALFLKMISAGKAETYTQERKDGTRVKLTMVPKQQQRVTEIDDELAKLSKDTSSSDIRTAKRISYDGFIKAFFKRLISSKRLFSADVPKNLIYPNADQTVLHDVHVARGAKKKPRGRSVSFSAIASSGTNSAVKTRKAQILDIQSKATTADITIAAQVKGGVFRIADAVEAKTNARIQFFFFGDLLDTAIEILESEGMFKKDMLVASGPLIYSDPRSKSGAYKSVNLADVPISLNLFTRWWVEEVVLPAQRIFSLQAFITSAADRLITEALGDNCITVAGKEFHDLQGKTKVKMANMTLKQIKGKSVIKRGGRQNISALKKKIKPIPAHIKGKNLTHVLFIYSENLQAEIPRQKREKDEKERGIFHLSLGSDRGLVKKMNFSALEQAHGKEAKAEANDELSANALPTRYKCEVVLVGTAAFQPGSLIYLKPWPRMGANLARALNLEGYYSINTVEGVLENGKFETTLNTVWQNSSKFGREGITKGSPAARKLKGETTFAKEQKEYFKANEEAFKEANQKLIDQMAKDGKFPHADKLTVPQGYVLTSQERGEIEIAYRDRLQERKRTYTTSYLVATHEPLVMAELQADLNAHKWGSKDIVTDPTPPDLTQAGYTKEQQKDFNEKYKVHYKALQKKHPNKQEEHDWLDQKAVEAAISEMGTDTPDIPEPITPPAESKAPEEKNVVSLSSEKAKAASPAPTGTKGELTRIPVHKDYEWTHDDWRPAPLFALPSHVPLTEDELEGIKAALTNAALAESETPTPDVQKMLEAGELTTEKTK